MSAKSFAVKIVKHVKIDEIFAHANTHATLHFNTAAHHDYYLALLVGIVIGVGCMCRDNTSIRHNRS